MTKVGFSNFSIRQLEEYLRGIRVFDFFEETNRYEFTGDYAGCWLSGTEGQLLESLGAELILINEKWRVFRFRNLLEVHLEAPEAGRLQVRVFPRREDFGWTSEHFAALRELDSLLFPWLGRKQMPPDRLVSAMFRAETN